MSKNKHKAAILSTVLLLAVIGLTANYFFQKTQSGVSRANAILSIKVSGNSLVDGLGKPVRLIGVDLGSTQNDCTASNPSFYDTTINSSFMSALESWHVNVVRITLNEDCWLGINGVSPSYSGPAYQNFVESTVNTMNSAGIEVLLSLARALPGTQEAGDPDGTGPLPDSDHSLTFWTSVASTFAGDPGVIFGAYGEPEKITWSCWLNGCTVDSPAGGTYQGVGMQQLVDTIRATGANQPIMLGGIDFSSDLSDWLANEPTDPDHQLIASFHNYNDGTCNTSSCWNSTIAPVNSTVPVLTDELGEKDCADSYIDSYMSWADSHDISYLGWAWEIPDSGSCKPALLSNYNGTPSTYGASYQAHLDQLYQAGDIADLTSNSTTTGSGSGGTSSPSPGSSSKASGSSSSSSSTSSKTGSPSPTKTSSSSSSPTNPSTGANSPTTSTAVSKLKNHQSPTAWRVVGSVLLLVALAGLFVLYWLVITSQDNKLRVSFSKSPPFLRFQIHPTGNKDSINSNTTGLKN